MRKVLLSVIGLSLLLAACGSSDVEVMSQYGNEVNDFEVTDENGDTFAREEMEGKVWLLNFMFTNCATVCPPMTANMTQAVNALEDKGVEDYGVLSFTVDPQTDTPEVMSEYLAQYGVPEDTEWKLLNGYDYEFIRGFAEDNFRTIVAPPPEGSNQVTHGTNFYLIDQNGKVIKDYSGIATGDSEFPLEDIVSDVETVAEEGPQ